MHKERTSVLVWTTLSFDCKLEIPAKDSVFGEMGGESSIGRRTRGQWDDYYKNLHSDLKRKKHDDESGGNGSSGKRLQNVVDTSGRKSVEACKSSRSGNVAVLEEKKDAILASEKTRKVGSVLMSDVQDDSSLKSSSESGSGSGDSSLKSSPESESGSGSDTEVDNEVGSGGNNGGGRSSCDEEKVLENACVDLEGSTDSGNSEESSDDSDDDMIEAESESTSEEDYESSDEDFRVSETDESSSGDVHEQENGDNNDENEEMVWSGGTKRMKGSKGSGIDEEDSRSNGRVEKELFRVGKKETRGTVEQEDGGEDDRVDAACHQTNDSSSYGEDDDEVVTNDKAEFVSIKTNARKNRKLNGDLKVEMNLEDYFKSSKSSKSKEDSFASFIDKFSKYEDSYRSDRMVKRGKQWSDYKAKHGWKRSRSTMKLDMMKILVDSINANKDQNFNFSPEECALPRMFRFEDEVVPPKEKSEWEEEVDSLFRELEFGLRESEMDTSNFSEVEPKSTKVYETPAALCGRGEHLAILDEEIGIICKYCHALLLDIKYVLPPFYKRPSVRGDKMDGDASTNEFRGPIQFPGSDGKSLDSTCHIEGTVWDLIPGVKMFPHQCEGFEFIWKNIAGGIVIDRLKETFPRGRGCIISHAPGTGKTRLTIVFLQTFLKLYPNCCPMIIAPKGMLLTWEAEFVKWGFHFPFHNLNKKEPSGNENAIASQIFGQPGSEVLNKELIRLLKLYSWTKGGGILGIGYNLFEKLAGDNVKEGLNEKIREVLLQRPGLMVLDEGHTPRNNKSLIWKALSKVDTQRKIILSGTPFQNNMQELYNTLCLVNPKFVNQIGLEDDTSVDRKRWKSMTNSICKSKDEGLKKLRAMLDPFVHVHNGNILQENLPGLRHTLVFLHPPESQKALLEAASEVKNIWHSIRLVSLVSVHPSLKVAAQSHTRAPDKRKLAEIELDDVDDGVKMKFLMKLIWLADALGERVLVFSQFLHPLLFIMKQLERHFSWNEGREVLYMDGKLKERQRQDSINSLNDDASEAKVLLASVRACSEGINLVGASRVVLLDTLWNPSVEKQAISRAYRLGQRKVVHVYRLFTSGIEVRIFAQQITKRRLSKLIFSLGSGEGSEGEKSGVISEDKLLDSMLSLERFKGIFEKIISQPKESELLEIFGLEKQK